MTTSRQEAARWLSEAWGDSGKAEEMLLTLTERESNREDESSGRTAGRTREQIGEEREVLVAGTPMPKKPRPGSTPGTPDQDTPTPPSDATRDCDCCGDTHDSPLEREIPCHHTVGNLRQLARACGALGDGDES